MYVSIDAARAADGHPGRGTLAPGVELAEWTASTVGGLHGCAASGARSSRATGSPFDPTRLTVAACDLGLSGYELETILRDDYRSPSRRPTR